MRTGKLALQFGISFIMLMAVYAGLLFIPAGTWDYWQAWAYLAAFGVPALVISVYFLLRDPAFLARRMKWREPERAQQISQSVISVLYFGGFVIAGLDQRYGWSQVPAILTIVSDLLIVGGFVLVWRVFVENRYAATTIEVEEGQPVISTGPYALVRHPMYLGALPMLLLTPLALGSYWAFCAYVPVTIALLFRIRNEEAVLLRDLPGYAEYRRSVRWRLIPGVW